MGLKLISGWMSKGAFMKACLKIAALAYVVSVASIGMASANMTRTAVIQMCWTKAHKESPVGSGNDVNTSALAKGAYYLYVACMQRHGFPP
jgi:hypothetical protein